MGRGNVPANASRLTKLSPSTPDADVSGHPHKYHRQLACLFLENQDSFDFRLETVGTVSGIKYYNLRANLFLFLAYSGLVYAAGRRKKRKKKHTEHERVQFLLRLNTRGLSYTHAAQATRHLGNPNNVSTRLTKALT